MKIEAGKAKPLIYIAITLFGFYFIFNMNKTTSAERVNNTQNVKRVANKTDQQKKNKPKPGNESKSAKPQKENNKKSDNKGSQANQNNQANTFQERYSQAGTQGQDNIDKKSTSFGFMQVTFILLIIGLIAYFVYKYFNKKKEGFSGGSEFVNVLFTTALAANKHLQVVQIFDSVYILGVGDNSVNLITQLNDKNLINKLRSESDKRLPSLTFKEQIMKIVDKLKPGSGMPNDPEDEAISFFKEQREKVNGIRNKNGNGNSGNDLDKDL